MFLCLLENVFFQRMLRSVSVSRRFARKDINTKSNHREMKKGQILEQKQVICIAAEIWHAPDSSDDEVWGLERKTDQHEGDLEEL